MVHNPCAQAGGFVCGSWPSWPTAPPLTVNPFAQVHALHGRMKQAARETVLGAFAAQPAGACAGAPEPLRVRPVPHFACMQTLRQCIGTVPKWPRTKKNVTKKRDVLGRREGPLPPQYAPSPFNTPMPVCTNVEMPGMLLCTDLAARGLDIPDVH